MRRLCVLLSLGVVCFGAMCLGAVHAAPAAAQRINEERQAPADSLTISRRSAPPVDAPRSLTQYVHRSWTAEDGLPYDAVWSIIRTRDGYLWIGTMGGLARFDGAQFVSFTTRNTAALPNNGISALYEDADGALWIGTLGGLTRYQDGQFTTLTTRDGLPSNNVWAVAGGPDGTLWVGTLGGLTRYRDGQFTTYTTSDGLLTNDVRAVSVTEEGAVWFGTYGGGAHQLVDGQIRTYPLTGTPSGPWLHRLLAGRDGTVWVGVGQGQADRSPHQLLRLDEGRYSPAVPDRVLYSVRALHEGRDRGLWIGTYGGGLARYADGELQSFSAAEGLTDNRVQALYEDGDGNLWAGTMGGLDLLRRASPFTTIATEEGLPHDNVRGVVQGATGAVWIATAEGLARLDADGVKTFTADDGLPEPFVQSIWARQDSTVWLGGQNSVTRYADGVFTLYELPAGWPEGVIRSIVEDLEGQLWLGSIGAGLVRFVPGGSRAFTATDGLAHNSVTALLPARDGGLWVGTARGLNRMMAGQIRPFKGEEAFSGINVRSLYEDEGTLWVGTYARGLMRYRDGQVTVYTVRDGLHDDGVWSILEDDTGALWMSSNRGVFRVAKSELEAVATDRCHTLTPTVYGVADGMKTAEANGASKPSGWRTRDGRMWFATQRGLVVVDPATATRTAPAPIIEGIRANGEPIQRAGDALALPASARDFTVAYTSLSFSDPERLRFRYRLDGFTDGWVDAQGRREAIFTNVPAGRYAFRVAARNGNGDWVEGKPLALTIAPFFWETVGFRLLVALAVTGLVALVVSAQGRRQRRREAALEAQVATRTDELRRAKETTEAQAAQLLELDAAKSRFFANISHEFRTPLTLTLGPLNDMLAGLYGSLDAPMAQQVGLARRNAGLVLDLINQILDISRLEAGRTSLHARPLDLGAFVEDVAQPFEALAVRKAMTFETDLPTTPVEVFADPQQFEKVIANLLSNALKFTPEGGTVRVRIAAEGEMAQVAVRDSGPGIPAADLPHVFDRFYQVSGTAQTQLGTGIGLALAKEIMDLHGGTLAVQSEEGFGSRFILTLPLGRAHLTPDQIVDDEPWRPGEALFVHPVKPDDGDHGGEKRAVLDDTDVTTVLVVDDHAEVRTYVRRHLEATPEDHSTYRVVEAADGETGLALAKARLPDLVLSDVMMPGMDGFALCRALKSDPATDFIPIILLTAKAAPEDKLEGLGELADDYLTKPFDPVELRARIANLIALRTRLRERFRQEGMAFVLGENASAPPFLSPLEPVTSADEAFLERVREAVEAHLSDETFSVQRLAEAIGVSRSHLHRQLKAFVGQTPTDLIRTTRLERSTHLLAGQAGTVSEIAYAVGFKSIGHFSDSFLQAYGCRPSAYAAREGAGKDETP